MSDPTTTGTPGPKHPDITPIPGVPNPYSKHPTGCLDVDGATRSGAKGVDMNETRGMSNAHANANSSTQIDALRAQGQALTYIAQALLVQIESLNKQVDALLC